MDSVESEEGLGLVSMPASTRASTLTLVLVSAPVSVLVLAEEMLGVSLLDPPEVMLSDLQEATEDLAAVWVVLRLRGRARTADRSMSVTPGKPPSITL